VYKIPLFDKYNDKITYGISGRTNGVSQGEYDSLNLGLHVGDNSNDVIKNREIFCSSLGISLANTVCCEQVHKTNVHMVTSADKGKGAYSLTDTIKDVDALITNEKNIPLMLFFADCTPLLIYDPVHEAIGAAHAGWRGTVGDIAGKTLTAMHKSYSTNPADCVAAIGPCIGQCCYEIGNEVSVEFINVFTNIKKTINPVDNILIKKGSNYHLSLYNANKILLIEHGLLPENISPDTPYCTACHNKEFYSYRADKGKTGRHCALLCLK